VAEGSAIMRAEINSQPKQLVRPNTSLIIYLFTNGVSFCFFFCFGIRECAASAAQINANAEWLIEVKFAKRGVYYTILYYI